MIIVGMNPIIQILKKYLRTYQQSQLHPSWTSKHLVKYDSQDIYG